MYVRSYGMPPRSVKKDGAPVVLGLSDPPDDSDVAAMTAEAADNAVDTLAPDPSAETVRASENESSAAGQEKDAVPVFGSSGIPRQPLRRRTRPRKDVSHGKSTENGELSPLNADSAPEPLSPSVNEGERPPLHLPAPNDSDHQCSRKADKREDGRGESAIRKRVGALATDDLILGGLILLLLNEGASDDILIILAFLFASGFGLNRAQ